MKNSISFSIFDTSSNVTSFLNTVDDLTYHYKPVEMAFDSAIDAPKLVELILTFSSGVGLNIFASWLYERLKNDSKNTKNKESYISLNGTQISGNN